MGILDGLYTFVGSMHISAQIIISIIIFIFLCSLLFILILRGKYNNIRNELEKQTAIAKSSLAASRNAETALINDRFSEPRFRNIILRGIISEYESAWMAQRSSDVNTQAIIENHFITKMKAGMIQESFARHSVSMMIVLGLLGTFIGLTISVQSLVLLFRGYDVTELLSSVESGLLSALAGMSTAFTTSLFGIACSVIITIMNVFINPAQSRENLMVGVEEYLDNVVSARMKALVGDGYERMNDALRSTFIDFGEKIADRFDRSLIVLREDVRGIEEVNNNLRNTIEQMDVSFVRIADALKASTRHIDDNYQSLTDLSTRLKDMNEAYENTQKANAAHSEGLINTVTEAAGAISALTGDLRGEAQRRLDNFASYESAIAQMANSAELIRGAVAAIPDQMYAYTEASRIPAMSTPPLRAAAFTSVQESINEYANDVELPGAGGNDAFDAIVGGSAVDGGMGGDGGEAEAEAEVEAEADNDDEGGWSKT